MLITSCTWVLCHFITCTRIGNKRCIIWCNLFLSGGGTGGVRTSHLPYPALPLPVPLSPASRPLPCCSRAVIWDRLLVSIFCNLTAYVTHVHSCRLTFYDLYDITTINKCTISPEVSLFLSPSAKFLFARLLGSLNGDWKDIKCKSNIIWVDAFESNLRHC